MFPYVGKQISLRICVSRVGEGYVFGETPITRDMFGKTPITRDMCLGKHLSLGICVRRNTYHYGYVFGETPITRDMCSVKHISLWICVRRNTYHYGYVFGETPITRDMCSGKHISIGIYIHTYILLLTLPKKGFAAQYNTIKNTDLNLYDMCLGKHLHS